MTTSGNRTPKLAVIFSNNFEDIFTKLSNYIFPLKIMTFLLLFSFFNFFCSTVLIHRYLTMDLSVSLPQTYLRLS